MMRLRFPAVLMVAACALLVTEARAQMQLNGAGATFPYPIYSKWFNEYTKVDLSVQKSERCDASLRQTESR